MRLGRLAALVLCCALAAAPAAADACRRAVVETRAAAFDAFQHALTALIVEADPAAADAATLHRDQQLARMAIRTRALLRALETRPGDFFGLADLSALMNADTSPEHAALAAEDAEYRLLVARRETIDAAAAADTVDWPALRTTFRETVAPSPAYAAALARQTEAYAAADARLADCPRPTITQAQPPPPRSALRAPVPRARN